MRDALYAVVGRLDAPRGSYGNVVRLMRYSCMAVSYSSPVYGGLDLIAEPV